MFKFHTSDSTDAKKTIDLIRLGAHIVQLREMRNGLIITENHKKYI